MLEAVTPGHRFSKNIDRCKDEQADQRCGDEPRHVGLPSYIWRYQASLSVRLTGDKGEGAGSCISACRAINETTDTERWSKSRAPGFLQPSPNAAVRAFPYGPVAPTPQHAPPRLEWTRTPRPVAVDDSAPGIVLCRAFALELGKLVGQRTLAFVDCAPASHLERVLEHE